MMRTPPFASDRIARLAQCITALRRSAHPSEVRMMSRRGLCSAIAGVALVAAAAAAAAEGETWPTRAIKVISPFTARNANDTVARVVLDQVLRQLGYPFVIENKPGGGGRTGRS